MYSDAACHKSYSQIEEVLNQDITTLSDEGVSNNLINKLAHGRNKEYTITLEYR